MSRTDDLPTPQEAELAALRASLRETRADKERLWGERMLIIHGLDIMKQLDAGGDFVDVVLAAAGRTRAICTRCKEPGTIKVADGWVCAACFDAEKDR